MKALFAAALALVIGAPAAACSDRDWKACQGKPWVVGDIMETPLGERWWPNKLWGADEPMKAREGLHEAARGLAPLHHVAPVRSACADGESHDAGTDQRPQQALCALRRGDLFLRGRENRRQEMFERRQVKRLEVDEAGDGRERCKDDERHRHHARRFARR